MFLFDIAPSLSEGSAAGVLVGAVFFFIVVASGAFAFVMLRKTVKMAIRMIVVAAILLIAIVGSVALYLFTGNSSPKPVVRPYSRPSANSTR